MRNRKTKAAVICGLIIAIVLVLVLVFVIDFGGGDTATAQRETLTYEGKSYVTKRTENILLIGIDKSEDTSSDDKYINNQQADFLLVIAYDRANKSAEFLQLNRDTMCDIQRIGATGQAAGTYNAQLALSHTFGSGGKDSCIYTKNAVENFLGIRIDDYIAIYMDAIPTINDKAGYVTLTCMDDMTDTDPALEEGKEVTLKGEQALTYIRQRMSLADSTNLHRMERQRQYMKLLWKNINQKASEDEKFIRNVFTSISDDLLTSLSSDRIEDLFTELKLGDDIDFRTLKGENKKGSEFMEYYVDVNDLKKTVVEMFYREK